MISKLRYNTRENDERNNPDILNKNGMISEVRKNNDYDKGNHPINKINTSIDASDHIET